MACYYDDQDMQDKKRHHTVARFYLEGFSDAEGFLWQYPRDGASPKLVQPSNAAVGKRFYSIQDSTGRWNNQIEDALARLESEAAPALS